LLMLGHKFIFTDNKDPLTVWMISCNNAQYKVVTRYSLSALYVTFLLFGSTELCVLKEWVVGLVPPAVRCLKFSFLLTNVSL
jgi:hypothetical protein